MDNEYHWGVLQSLSSIWIIHRLNEGAYNTVRTQTLPSLLPRNSEGETYVESGQNDIALPISLQPDTQISKSGISMPLVFLPPIRTP